MKLDKSLSNAIPKGPLRNATCPLTDQTSKMKKNKTKLIIMKHRKKKKKCLGFASRKRKPQ